MKEKEDYMKLLFEEEMNEYREKQRLKYIDKSRYSYYMKSGKLGSGPLISKKEQFPCENDDVEDLIECFERGEYTDDEGSDNEEENHYYVTDTEDEAELQEEYDEDEYDEF